MTLPNRPSIELPLLLELERAGGAVRPSSKFYDMVAAHFPDIQPADRQILRGDGRTKVWENTVDWARNMLRVRHQLNGGQRGVWQITDAGRQRLRQDLVRLGIPAADVESFIRGGDTLAQRLGHRWTPVPLRPRPGGQRRPKPTPPFQETGREPQVAPATAAAEAPASDIRAQLLARLQGLTPAQFEHLVAAYLRSEGLAEVQVTARSHDGGIDGHCVVPFVQVKVGFQAKRFASTQLVGAPIMQQFKGSLAYSGNERGILVTTSDFTQGAIEMAEGPGVPIVLVNGQNLVDRMLEKGLGIRTIPVTKREIDEGFFENLTG